MLQANGLTIILFGISLALAGFVALQAWAKGRYALDWAEALFLALVSVVVLVGWVGVVLAEIGRFSLFAIAVILLLIAGAVLWRIRPFIRPTFVSIHRHEVALCALLLGCTTLYFRPHEYVLGGADAGGYLNIAAMMVRSGDFVLHDEQMDFLSQYPEVALREQPAHWRTRYLQFVGWYIDDTDPTRIIPQFFPFHPTLIAVGVAVGGLYGGLLVTPLWGVLGISAVYFLARRLLGSSIALLAAFLLAITPTHLYFARYPTTEPLTLLLVFAGLLVCQVLWDEGGGFTTEVQRTQNFSEFSLRSSRRGSERSASVWGTFGGLVWGAAFLTRNDLPIVALLLVAFMLLAYGSGRWSRGWAAFAWVLALSSLYALASAVFINWPYLWNTYGYPLQLLVASPVSLGILTVGGVVSGVGTAVLWWRGQLPVAVGWLAKWVESPWVRWAIIFVILGLSAYAYFLRPILEPITYSTNWPSKIPVPKLNGQNWVRMGWYLTPLGLLLATLGAARLVQRQSLLRLGLFLSVSLLTTLQYVYNIFNTAYHIYTMRRYVPIVIPSLMIFTAVAILVVWQFRPTWWAKTAGVLLVGVLASGMVYQARFVLPLRENAGAVAQLTALNQQLQPEAILLISEPAEAIFADTFGVPLHFIFGHQVVTVRGGGAEIRPFLADLQARAEAMERPIQLLAIDTLLPEVRESLHLEPVGMFPVTLQILMNSFYEFPSILQTAYYGIEIYNVTAEPVPTPNELTIDIGGLDSAYIQSGFYYKEPLLAGPTMRWTTSEAVLSIPDLDQGRVTLEVQAMIYRPTAAPSTPVTVWLNGSEIGQFTPTDSWQTYTFEAELPPSEGETLEFITATFNPARLQLSEDMRELGFLLDWVKIR